MKKIFCILIVAALAYAILMNTVFSYTYKAESESDRARCIQQYGWKIDKETEEKAEITIPEPLNRIYLKYNEIQKKSGFDISEYKGRKVCRYTYKVLNHKHGGEVYANIFVCDGKMIAADIMARSLGGFMHEINRKEFKD